MRGRHGFVMMAVLLLLAPVADAALNAGLIITEVVEGNGATFKYVEIWNSGPTAIDLSVTTVQLQRYTNGGTAAGATVTLTSPGTIPVGGFYVIANNATDFNAIWPLPAAANQYSTVINHNGNDSYQLLVNSVVVDGFAYDAVTGVNPVNFAADGSYQRVRSAYANNGNWGTLTQPADGATSPSGYWVRAALTAANANAASVCTPGRAGGSGGAELPVELQSFEIK